MLTNAANDLTELYTISLTTGAATLVGTVGDGSLTLPGLAAAPDDFTPPTVSINQAAGQADVTIVSPVLFTYVFSEPVVGFGAEDVLLTGTAGAANAIVTESGSLDGTIFTVAVSGMIASGTVTPTILLGPNVTDLGGNELSDVESDDNTVTFVFGPSTRPGGALVADPDVPGKMLLVVGGSASDDRIDIRRKSTFLCVEVNGQRQLFSPTDVSGIVAFGLAGNDRIVLSSILALSCSVFYGGDGNDTLTGGSANDILDGGAGHDSILGGSGNDILVGQDGNDRLLGQIGRDILIGGDGTDRLYGGSGDDILIGDCTIYDNDHALLGELLTVWTSTASYTSRVIDLQAGTGAPPLSDAHITDNFFGTSVFDELFGELGNDFFFHSLGDSLPGRRTAEAAVQVN